MAKCCMCCSDSTRSFELKGDGSDSDPFLVVDDDNDNTSLGDDRCDS